jgi:indolepyruvate ferredoxin oxidoreductase
VSGYRGSPLGMVDQQVWKAVNEVAGRHPLPAGDQRGTGRHRGAGHAARGVRPRAHRRRRVRDVVRQGPGRGPRRRRAQARQRLRLVRRTAACWWWPATTTAACRRRCRTRATVLQAWQHAGAGAGRRRRVPGVRPLRLGAVALLGAWVGFKALSEVVESGMTVDLDRIAARFAAWVDAGHRARRHRPPAAARRPALPLARPALAAHRDAARRQARRGARLRARQLASTARRRQRRRRAWASSPPARPTTT